MCEAANVLRISYRECVCNNYHTQNVRLFAEVLVTQIEFAIKFPTKPTVGEIPFKETFRPSGFLLGNETIRFAIKNIFFINIHMLE